MGQLGNHATRHRYNEMNRTLEGVETDWRMILICMAKMWDLTVCNGLLLEI
jgi:hypothetical protein